MLTFLFWNMGGRIDEPDLPKRARGRDTRLASILRNLTSKHAVDLLILAECPLPAGDVLRSINTGGGEQFRPADPNSLCPRIIVFPRFPARFMKRREESDKYTCREVVLPARVR